MVITTIKSAFLKISRLLLFCFFSLPLNAIEWDINPYIELKSDFSDNIFLFASDKTPSFVAQLNPGLVLKGKGAHSEYALDYRLQTLSYSTAEIEDTYYQQAGGHFSYDLVKNALTFYSDASMGQASKDIYQESLDGNLTDPENITNVYRLKSGFLWDQHVKNKASIYLDANANYLNEKESLPNVKGWDIKFNTKSTYQINSGFWDISYLGSERKADQAKHNLLQQSRVQLGAQAWRHLALFAIGNRERNDVPDSVVNADLNTGSVGAGVRWVPNKRTILSAAYNFGVYKDTPDFWSLDFSLKPNPRIKISGSYGQRFYGDAYDFGLYYQGKHLFTQFVYKEQLSSYSRNDGSISPARCDEGDTACELAAAEELPEGKEEYEAISPISSAVYLDRKASWTIKRSSGRHAFIIDLSYSERDYVTLSEEERDLAGKFDWHLYLGKRSTLKLDSLYRKLMRSDRTPNFQTGNTLQYGDEWLVGMSFDRKLSRRSNLVLRLQHKDKEGQVNVDSYVENRVGLYYTLKTKQY